MSYMRGRNYLWRDDTSMHFWIDGGYDGWDEAGWVLGLNAAAGERPSGVAIQQEIVDEYVVMRFAELLESGALSATMERAMAKYSGNGGCRALQASAATLAEL